MAELEWTRDKHGNWVITAGKLLLTVKELLGHPVTWYWWIDWNCDFDDSIAEGEVESFEAAKLAALAAAEKLLRETLAEVQTLKGAK